MYLLVHEVPVWRRKLNLGEKLSLQIIDKAPGNQQWRYKWWQHVETFYKSNWGEKLLKKSCKVIINIFVLSGMCVGQILLDALIQSQHLTNCHYPLRWQQCPCSLSFCSKKWEFTQHVNILMCFKYGTRVELLVLERKLIAEAFLYICNTNCTSSVFCCHPGEAERLACKCRVQVCTGNGFLKLQVLALFQGDLENCLICVLNYGLTA